MKKAIGIDLGGTNLRIALVDSSGKILEKYQKPLEEKTVEAAVYLIETEVQKMLLQNSPPVGIGVGIAGMIDAVSGSVKLAPNLFWKNVQLANLLEEKLSFPVRLINDVRAAARAELLFGSAKSTQNAVFISMGTGIGGGVIAHGILMEGSMGNFGEIGHFIIEKNGRLCTCGSFGCLEAYIGGASLSKIASERYKRSVELKELVLLFRQGEKVACQIVQEAVEAFAAGMQTILYAYNPEKVFFAGGLVSHFPELIYETEKWMRKNSFCINLDRVVFEKSVFLSDGGVIGSASLFF